MSSKKLTFAFALLVACTSPDAAISDAAVASSEVLATARALASPSAELSAALATSHLAGSERAFAVAEPGSLFFETGRDLREGLQVGRTGAPATRTSVTLVDAAPTEADLVDGVVIHRDVHADTDAIVVAAGARAEVFYLLRGPDAPRAWRWSLAEGPELSPELRDGALALRDVRGDERIRISAPAAIDGSGREVAVTMEWSDGEIRFELADGEHAYPVLVDPVIEAIDWSLVAPEENPFLRERHAMAYDAARGRMVLFGGRSDRDELGDTWEWDGVRWRELAPPSSPSARSGHAMVYDSRRQRVVLFGGGCSHSGCTGYLDDTWEWDGSTWTRRVSATSPSPREAHGMAYDSARGRVVLFGGNDLDFQRFGDTWEWDGTDWTERSPLVSPSARASIAMAYDAARHRTVLFAGDTWEWDGETWSERVPTVSPAARSALALAYDARRERVVLFSGATSGGAPADTWEWDGHAWTERTTPTGPRGRQAHALAYDSARGAIVLFGGAAWASSAAFADTWEWDGSTWVERTLRSRPRPRIGTAAAHDAARGRVVLFGGIAGVRLDDTWEWDGATWSARSPATRPTPRYLHALAYDSERARVVLFGGQNDLGSGLSDTWEWDGTSWTDSAPTTRPTPRDSHALAYDAARHRVVLFGGWGPTGWLSDTWEWDGTDWTQRFPTTSPSARIDHAMAYDAARGRVVLFGGDASTGVLSDTWEWDGVSWSRRVTPVSPSPRRGHGMVYDAGAARIVLFGGGNDGHWPVAREWYRDTWEWDGTTWAERLYATRPLAREHMAMTYDVARGRAVLFGGSSTSGAAGDTWELYSSRARGSDCSTDSECGSRVCVDGVCCASDCGGGALDCQACSVAAGGTEDGRCTPLSAALAPTIECRAVSGVCDVAERCSPTSTACPVDEHIPATAVCRAAIGECDAAETCTGLDGTCPPDASRAGGTCGATPTDACDAADVCVGELGATAVCQPRLVPAGTPCRIAAGVCDVAESCSGSDVTCPDDALVASGIECRGTAGVCDVPEACSGIDAECPADGFVAAATECRGSEGACDVAESCSGTGPSCPENSVAPDGTGCGDELICNGGESCLAGTCTTGTTLACDDEDPCTADACTEPDGCMHEPVIGCGDAGLLLDAGALVDGGVGADAAARADAEAAADGGPEWVEPTGGCACRATSTRRSPGTWIAVVAIGGTLTLRRRRRGA